MILDHTNLPVGDLLNVNKSNGGRPLLVVDHITKYYDQPITWRWFTTKKDKYLPALDDINLMVYEGETLGLAGESGSGKTTLGRLILRLLEPTSGSVHFLGEDIFRLSSTKMRKLRRAMQIIFQDNLSSLNPRKSVRKILSQPFLTHKLLSKEEADVKAKELLIDVGLSPPELYMDRYPHELSGGQRQRISVARAIALEPKLIIADEPVSALDVATRSQILDLLIKLKKEHSLTYLFISHDLSVVRAVSDRVAVMYLGKIVEISRVQELFERPLHPYTMALLSSILPPDPQKSISEDKKLNLGIHSVTSDSDAIPGCKFNPRCPYVIDKCRVEEPHLEEMSEGHFVACYQVGQNHAVKFLPSSNTPPNEE